MLYVSINCSALEGYIHHKNPLYTSTLTNGFFQMVTYIIDIVANIIEHVHIGNMDVVLVCLYSAIESVYFEMGRRLPTRRYSNDEPTTKCKIYTKFITDINNMNV